MARSSEERGVEQELVRGSVKDGCKDQICMLWLDYKQGAGCRQGQDCKQDYKQGLDYRQEAGRRLVQVDCIAVVLFQIEELGQ